MRGTRVSRIFVFELRLAHRARPSLFAIPLQLIVSLGARWRLWLKRKALAFLSFFPKVPARDDDFHIHRHWRLHAPDYDVAMNEEAPSRTPVAAAGIVCIRGDDVLLVQRGKPPLADRWSLPGGRIEWGERASDAALRELKEETGCDAELIGLIDVVDAVFASRESGESPPWGHYVLIDYAARWLSGEPRAGDDARDARFFSPDAIAALELWDETIRIIEAARRML